MKAIKDIGFSEKEEEYINKCQALVSSWVTASDSVSNRFYIKSFEYKRKSDGTLDTWYMATSDYFNSKKPLKISTREFVKK